MKRYLNPSPQPFELEIKIQIEASAIAKLWFWTDLAQEEISWLGLVEEVIDEEHDELIALRITDFYLVTQQCGAAETELEPAAISELMSELEPSGISPRKLRCWAHSHGAMGVFWSSIDSECIANLNNGEWLLSLVVNKRHQALMRLDIFNPVHLYVSNVLWEVHYPLVDSMKEQCEAEFKTKVIEAPSLPVNIQSDYIDQYQEIQEACRRGILTEEELAEELWLYDLEPDDLDELQPF